MLKVSLKLTGTSTISSCKRQRIALDSIGWYSSIYGTQVYTYLPSPLLGLDMTQGQFLSRV